MADNVLYNQPASGPTFRTRDIVSVHYPVSAADAVTLTDRSGSITTGGTAQTLAAANTSRRYLIIQNTGAGTLWFNFTTAAVQTQPSFRLDVGASFEMPTAAGVISTEAISIIGATTGQVWTAKEA